MARTKPISKQPKKEGGFFTITVPFLARRFLELVAVAGLLSGFWDSLFRLFGMGTILVVLTVTALLWMAWQRKFSLLWQKWNRWLGAIAFAAALLGLLAWPDEVSWGGELGRAIIGSSTIFGGLRLAGIVAAGIALVAPHFMGKVVLSSARWSLARLKQGLGLMRRSILWLRSLYIRRPQRQAISATAAKEALPRGQEIIDGGGIKEASFSTERWQLPSTELLDKPAETKLTQVDVGRKARLIEEALASYGVEAKVVQMNVGPTVTQFGVEPGWDHKYREVKERNKEGKLITRLEEVSRTRVKVERITSLDKDLALALAASSIRIEAPVPGKSMIGVEVPNSAIISVTLRQTMETSSFQRLRASSKLALALGEGAGGESVVDDLAKMPHLLIAGATGSGKTVCLNSVITSLLMNNTPDELQLLLIDPKRVELISFNLVPHLASSVITDNEKAIGILQWLNHEMDSRYQMMAQVRARNVEMYNRSNKGEKSLPRLVLIIDELADLMTKANEVEPLLCRLAQMGRATGIHLVVATQRPSVDVVTGLIKANFPTRISFAVASQVDSRTILDSAGAERLLGRGDMLYLPIEVTKPKRLQGCFVSSQEIDRLVNFWDAQRQPQAVKVPPYIVGEEAAYDPLLEEARRLAKGHKTVSASFLQRQLHIGYSRATQLMELLEKENSEEH